MKILPASLLLSSVMIFPAQSHDASWGSWHYSYFSDTFNDELSFFAETTARFDSNIEDKVFLQFVCTENLDPNIGKKLSFWLFVNESSSEPDSELDYYKELDKYQFDPNNQYQIRYKIDTNPTESITLSQDEAFIFSNLNHGVSYDIADITKLAQQIVDGEQLNMRILQLGPRKFGSDILAHLPQSNRLMKKVFEDCNVALSESLPIDATQNSMQRPTHIMKGQFWPNSES